jgi:hypothetical protein
VGYINYRHNESDSFINHQLLAEHVEVTLNIEDPDTAQYYEPNIVGTLELRTVTR